MNYLIISLKHTKKDDPFITLWRPNDRGYCYTASNAGRYTEEDVKSHQDYYNNNESTIAVSEKDILPFWERSEGISPNYMDREGFVLPNTRGMWEELYANRYQFTYNEKEMEK